MRYSFLGIFPSHEERAFSADYLREVCGMEAVSLWSLFLDTGDPMAYLLFRAGETDGGT